jgi:hypothetical protein
VVVETERNSEGRGKKKMNDMISIKILMPINNPRRSDEIVLVNIIIIIINKY